jgi:hypothetical protein
MALKLLRTSVWISVFVIVASSSLWAQTPPGWETYVNRRYGFSIAYPPIYKRVRPPHENLDADRSEAVAEGRWVRLNHEGDTIDILVRKERFDLDSFVTGYAPTGVEWPPRAQKEGNNTFYGYGAGHLGFPQADQFFFNLKGKTLYIRVDGPYTDETTTTDETKKMESQMLASFRTFPPAGSR